MTNEQIILEETDYRIKVTSVKDHVRNFELRLLGYRWNSKGNIWSPYTYALAGSNTINSLVGLLQPFCEQSNLLTIKQHKMFSKQKHDINSLANKILRRNRLEVPIQNQELILEIFKTTLQNMGDIIQGSKHVVEGTLITNHEVDTNDKPDIW